MERLSANALLEHWEAGEGLSPVRQAQVLLDAAYPGLPADTLAGFTVGRRDALLLALRVQLFGSTVTAVASCPSCRETVETSFLVQDILVDAKDTGTPPFVIQVGPVRVTFRLPTAGDVLALEGFALEEARQRLLEACLIEARHKDGPVPASALSEAVVAAVVAEMAVHDPQAEILLGLACPSCSHTWTALFDVVGFMWKELEAWGHRLLREVHALGRAYGWAEREILAMPAARRRRYLEMLSE